MKDVISLWAAVSDPKSSLPLSVQVPASSGSSGNTG